MHIPFLDLNKINLKFKEEFLEATQCIIRNILFVLGEQVHTFESDLAEYIRYRYEIGGAIGLDTLTLIHYPIPPHKQEAFKSIRKLSFPITENIHQEVLSLPISPVLSKEDIKHVCAEIKTFFTSKMS